MEAASGVAERCILVGQPAIDHRGKTALQEWLQARGRELPEYVIVAEDGPSYRRTYEVEVRCGECVARGRASRKKHAEQHAALLGVGTSGGIRGRRFVEPGRSCLSGATMNEALITKGIRSLFLFLAPLALASTVDHDASLSAVRKFQQIADGAYASGTSVELSQDEMNAFLRYHAAASIPEGIQDPNLVFREGGAILSAQIDLEKATVSSESLPALMRLLLRGTPPGRAGHRLRG